MSPDASTENSPLTPYLSTQIKLFFHDRTLAGQVATSLAKLGFAGISTVAVKPRFFDAMRQLYGELTSFDGLVLVNQPPKQIKDASGLSDQDLAFGEFFKGVSSFNTSARRTNADLLGKCLPIFVSPQDADIRLRIVSQLFAFGIMGVLMMSVQAYGMSKEDQLDERQYELSGYLQEFFDTKDHKLKEFKEYKSAAELAQRRAEAEKLMEEVEQYRQAGEFDKAIALCRRVTEVLPTDPEAFLEGGRLLVKRKKYPPAMQMFRDAEKVAEDLPTPNQEIANLRITQLKAHINQRQSSGQKVDREKIDLWMKEAVEGFETAVHKADAIRGLDPEAAGRKRTDAQARIAETILTANLGAILGEDHPQVRALGDLAQKTLTEKVSSGGAVDPRYLVQFGLMSFQQGDLAEAQRYLVQAAQNPELSNEACTKLNYIGTQLRKQGRARDAINIYNTLLELGPTFLGVALFNLAVALRTHALDLAQPEPRQAAGLELDALAVAMEAIYVDPRLPEDENFYQNTIMVQTLNKARAIFAAAAQAQPPAAPPPPPPATDATSQLCAQASAKVEALLVAKKEREALQLLYQLARTLKPFFLQFDRHASDEVKRFAMRLQPKLLKHPDPKMVVFGKVLGVLVQRAQKAEAAATPPLDKSFLPAMQALEEGLQARAAKELARTLAAQPALVGSGSHAVDENLLNLCREMDQKLAGVQMEKFAP